MTATLRHFSIEFDGSPSKPGETFIDCNREKWTVLQIIRQALTFRAPGQTVTIFQAQRCTNA